jgi:hypothetical protein
VKRRAAALVTGAILLVAACDATGAGTRSQTDRPSVHDAEETKGSFEPSITWVDCPADISVTFTDRHKCGVLEVMTDRTDPSKGTLELLVGRAWPQDGHDPGRFGFTYGSDIGSYDPIGGGMTGNATSLDLVGVKLEARGTGPRAVPSLQCPEIGEVAPMLSGAPTGDAGAEATFIDAVRRCREHLGDQGVDPTGYDVAANVADVDDLRRALGIDRWDVTSSYGTQSRYLVEAMRQHPETLGATYLDSPWPAGTNELIGDVELTRAKLDLLFGVCDAEPRCRGPRPLADDWQRALDRLADRPLTGTYDGPVGEPVEVLVDAPKLVRAARFALGGDGPVNLVHLPAAIRSAAAGRLHPVLAQIVGADPGMCFGYRATCAGQDDVAWGVHLTQLCRNDLPFLDWDRLDAAIAGEDAYAAAYDANFWQTVCDTWDVPPADHPLAELVHPPVPTLLMLGRFDSSTDLAWARRLVRQDDQVQLLIGYGDTHNTLGLSTCMRDTRDAWVANPSKAVDPDTCNGDRIQWQR